MQKLKFVLCVTLTSGIINLLLLYLQPQWMFNITNSQKKSDSCQHVPNCDSILQKKKKKTVLTDNLTNNLYIRRIQKNINIEKLKFHVKACMRSIEIQIADIQLINDSKEGLHIFVFNQATGSYMAKFYQIPNETSMEAQFNLQTFLDSIQDGRILIFVYNNRNINNHFHYSFHFNDFKDILSFYSPTIFHEDQASNMSVSLWIMIGIKGVGKVTEIIQHTQTDNINKNECLVLSESITLSQEIAICPNWENTPTNNAKRRMCQLLEGYRSLCSCDSTSIIPEFKKLQANSYINIPIIIISNNDPHYLLRTLSRLAQVTGINYQNILVYKDYNFEETKLIADLFNVQIFKIKSFSSHSFPDQLSYKYRTSIANAFRYFKNHQNLIFMEDNIDASSDYLNYYNQSQGAFVGFQNSSIFCIAGSSNNQICSHKLLDDVYLGESFPSHSFMLSRDIWVKYLSVYWPDKLTKSSWREWTQEMMKKLNYPCLYPLISREGYFGQNGAANLPYDLLQPSTKVFNYTLNLNQISSHQFYDNWIVTFLQSNSSFSSTTPTDTNNTLVIRRVFKFNSISPKFNPSSTSSTSALSSSPSVVASSSLSDSKVVKSKNIDKTISCTNIRDVSTQRKMLTNHEIFAIKVPMITREDMRGWRELQKCLNLSIEEVKACWYKNTCTLCLGSIKIVFYKETV